MAFEFSATHINEYHAQGYTVLRDLIPATLLRDLRSVADLGRPRRIAHVDNAVKLIIVRMGRGKVGRTGRHVHGLAIDEPYGVDTARVRSRRIEMRDEARYLGRADIENVEPGRLQAWIPGLVRHDHCVADNIQRIRAHPRMRQLGLDDDFGVARIAHVHRGEILRRRFVREPEDAPLIAGDLHPHAFAHAAKSLQFMVRKQFHVQRERLFGAGSAAWKC